MCSTPRCGSAARGAAQSRQGSKDLRMLGELLEKRPVVAQDDDAVATAEQVATGFFVQLPDPWLVVVGTVDKDKNIRGVEEISPATRLLNDLLRLVRQAEVVLVEFRNDVTFERGLASGEEPVTVLLTRPGAMPELHSASGQLLQEIADGEAVEETQVACRTVGEQAF